MKHKQLRKFRRALRTQEVITDLLADTLYGMLQTLQSTSGDEEFDDEGNDLPGELHDPDDESLGEVEDDADWAAERAENLAKSDAAFFAKYVAMPVRPPLAPALTSNESAAQRILDEIKAFAAVTNRPSPSTERHTAFTVYYDRLCEPTECQAIAQTIRNHAGTDDVIITWHHLLDTESLEPTDMFSGEPEKGPVTK
jgi:hypothetical protein